ncbi:hypothetical protein QWY28_02855 [Nocardioides sp. SOB77]|uniref:Uncharacterized protein n=1 Tax=Nocardioides oceani TaxID=3058369 RepID=A0ABT8FBQ6_9ACTN|nr:hypothetical protein [Nocardioides oceani]MDN4171875.1 hypothetical protein [Nocardioides oceani]
MTTEPTASAEPAWERLSVVFDPGCEAPLLLVASLMARRAVEVRSASLAEDDAGRLRFEALVRGRDRRVRSVVCALESRMGVLDAVVVPEERPEGPAARREARHATYRRDGDLVGADRAWGR